MYIHIQIRNNKRRSKYVWVTFCLKPGMKRSWGGSASKWTMSEHGRAQEKQMFLLFLKLAQKRASVAWHRRDTWKEKDKSVGTNSHASSDFVARIPKGKRRTDFERKRMIGYMAEDTYSKPFKHAQTWMRDIMNAGSFLIYTWSQWKDDNSDPEFNLRMTVSSRNYSWTHVTGDERSILSSEPELIIQKRKHNSSYLYFLISIEPVSKAKTSLLWTCAGSPVHHPK